jgi:hypothetical protein
MVICGREFTFDLIGHVQKIITENSGLSRVQISRRVCEAFGFRDAMGRLRDISCRIGLLKLHRKGLLCLPQPTASPPPKPKSHPEKSTVEGEIEPITCALADLGKIEIVKIGSADSKVSRTWSELMRRYHYLGNGPLCGAQMRYLIRSSNCGWLGGFAFSAAAWRVESRDTWIGWDCATRERNLQKVVCNSRFLILPQVKAPHLASHVLSLIVHRLAADWKQRYGVEPVLVETFVEKGRFKGTCYKAANWTFVGETKGRGRQDRTTSCAAPIKDMYLYPLRKDAREVLCEGTAPKSPPYPREYGDWSEEEFAQAQIGDARLVKRLQTISRDFYARPQANIPQACGSKAKTMAAYRFFEHDNTTMDTILKPHYESTLNRIGKEKVVLTAQDTTSLNYSTHPATENLGLIGSRSEGIIGLLVHDTMAFSTEGTPLGLCDVQCWARDPEKFGKKHLRKELPIEQKESYKWLRSYNAVMAMQKRCPNTTIISVGDREADIYELFELALSNSGNPLLLVRAERDRLLADNQGHLWEHVAQQPSSGIQEVRIPRRSQEKARIARLEVRFVQARLKPPKIKPNLSPVTIWAILTEETDAPVGVTPLRWMLLTTRPISSFESATEVIGWYCLRWGIEVYHRTLKSGCKIESRQLGSADRIEACLAIDMVVAWRVFHLTKLGRETPNVPCTVFFGEYEWKALVAYKTKNPVPPASPPTLREAMRMVGSLGGFLGRKGDGEPGTQTIWLGLQRLDDITEIWKLTVEHFAPHLLSSRSPPPVSSG